MSTKPIALLALIPAVILLLAAVACGDDDSNIRVRKGLIAAAPNQAEETASGSSRAQTAPAAPGSFPLPSEVISQGADTRLAPPFGPGPAVLFQEGQSGINVQGFGTATAPAEAATLQFFVIAGEGIRPEEPPVPEQTPPTPLLLTEADLQPLIDAIKGQGIADGDIEVRTDPVYYYDIYSPGSATINVNVGDIGRLDAIVEAVQAADAVATQITVQSVNVVYRVNDCAALERVAMVAAVEDSRERAQVLAGVLGVGVGNVVFASHYAYSTFGPSACTPGFFPLEAGGGQPYALGQSPEVEITSQVSVTFAIQ